MKNFYSSGEFRIYLVSVQHRKSVNLALNGIHSKGSSKCAGGYQLMQIYS